MLDVDLNVNCSDNNRSDPAILIWVKPPTEAKGILPQRRQLDAVPHFQSLEDARRASQDIPVMLQTFSFPFPSLPPPLSSLMHY